MNWIALAVLGLILTTLGLINFRLYRERKRWRELGDKDALREALASWEPLVLEHEKTLRGVKRFANRARYMTTDEPDELIPGLVGFVALDEVGLMGYPANPFDNKSDFEKWKQLELRKVAMSESDIVKRWMNTVTLSHWNRYQALVTLGRLQNSE